MLVPMRSSGDFLWGPIGGHFVRCALRKQSDSRSASARCYAHFRHPEVRAPARLEGWATHPTHPSRLAQEGSHLRMTATRALSDPTKKPPAGAIPSAAIVTTASVRLGPDLLLGEIHQSR